MLTAPSVREGPLPETFSTLFGPNPYQFGLLWVESQAVGSHPVVKPVKIDIEAATVHDQTSLSLTRLAAAYKICRT